ncbi:hypothetical protein Ahy_A07g031107 isoform B [Arachis hypogaea]|uniref:Uncharacterized protein n=1 Tax=Arachis hypogaea TaxID=3818 RepID=A0A445C2X4_ARAHY|nr:hypothetical protein Ahy_A07g031107 isoform B [Arachis hypogaea]
MVVGIEPPLTLIVPWQQQQKVRLVIKQQIKAPLRRSVCFVESILKCMPYHYWSCGVEVIWNHLPHACFHERKGRKRGMIQVNVNG